MKIDKEILITSPLLPDIQDLYKEIQEVWESKWVTNVGKKHQALEEKLKNVLKSNNISLFNNGTIALIVGLKALNLPAGSEVITTPFTFAAGPHSLIWNNLQPVFCDIEPNTMCIDANKIERLITEKTSAIFAVHVYGFPCDVEKIQRIASKYNLKVIYDAAHAFLTEIDNKSIGSFGDMTMFSFHATKLFNTIEGGCLVFQNYSLNDKISKLRNFGICGEEPIKEVGLNGKLNELQAAVGILNLKLIDEEREKRSYIKKFYNDKLSLVRGITIPTMPKNVKDSYQYYPILVERNYKITRDELCEKFKSQNIIVRKYFYPLCSDYKCYENLESSSKDNLVVANDIKDKIMCLPFHSGLSYEDQLKILNVISS